MCIPLVLRLRLSKRKKPQRLDGLDAASPVSKHHGFHTRHLSGWMGGGKQDPVCNSCGYMTPTPHRVLYIFQLLLKKKIFHHRVANEAY